MGAVTSTVAARFAFFPPNPPSYGVELPPPPPAAAAAPAAGAAAAEGEEVREKGGGGGSRVVELTGVPRRGNVEARRLRTKRGTEVVAMHVRQPGAKLTLLYSHGNAADLGQMYELFVELSSHLNVNLMGYATRPPLRRSPPDSDWAWSGQIGTRCFRPCDYVLLGRWIPLLPWIFLIVRLWIGATISSQVRNEARMHNVGTRRISRVAAS